VTLTRLRPILLERDEALLKHLARLCSVRRYLQR
jgi:hypothetical protein